MAHGVCYEILNTKGNKIKFINTNNPAKPLLFSNTKMPPDSTQSPLSLEEDNENRPEQFPVAPQPEEIPIEVIILRNPIMISLVDENPFSPNVFEMLKRSLSRRFTPTIITDASSPQNEPEGYMTEFYGDIFNCIKMAVTRRSFHIFITVNPGVQDLVIPLFLAHWKDICSAKYLVSEFGIMDVVQYYSLINDCSNYIEGIIDNRFLLIETDGRLPRL